MPIIQRKYNIYIFSYFNLISSSYKELSNDNFFHNLSIKFPEIKKYHYSAIASAIIKKGFILGDCKTIDPQIEAWGILLYYFLIKYN